MSLGDLYRRNKFSLAGELKPDRFRRKHYLPDQHVEGWNSDLQYIRQCWEDGESTTLETDFFEWLDPSQKPPRWPDLLSKP